jgi:hypothetical protein
MIDFRAVEVFDKTDVLDIAEGAVFLVRVGGAAELAAAAAAANLSVRLILEVVVVGV